MSVEQLKQLGLMPASLIERLERIARRHDRSRVAEAKVAIREYVERHEADEEKRAA